MSTQHRRIEVIVCWDDRTWDIVTVDVDVAAVLAAAAAPQQTGRRDVGVDIDAALGKAAVQQYLRDIDDLVVYAGVYDLHPDPDDDDSISGDDPAGNEDAGDDDDDDGDDD